MSRHPAGKARRRTYEVRRGDSLWEIAASRVEADEVARCTRALYRRNAEVVGSDPDLIGPQQQLVIPEGC